MVCETCGASEAALLRLTNELHKKERELSEVSTKFKRSKLQSKAKVAQLRQQLDQLTAPNPDENETLRNNLSRLILKLEETETELVQRTEESEDLRKELNSTSTQLSDHLIRIRTLEEQLELTRSSHSSAMLALESGGVSVAGKDSADKNQSKDSAEAETDAVEKVYAQLVYKDTKILDLNNLVLAKDRQILDLQELCREKEEVAGAKTRAIQIMHEQLLEKNRERKDVATETSSHHPGVSHVDLAVPGGSGEGVSHSPGRAVAVVSPRGGGSPPPLDPALEDQSSLTTESAPLDWLEGRNRELDNDELGESFLTESSGVSPLRHGHPLPVDSTERKKRAKKRVTFDFSEQEREKELRQLKEQIQDVEVACEELREENEELRSTISEQENSMEASRRTADEWELQYKLLKARSDQLEIELEESKKDGKNNVLKAKAQAQVRIKDLEDAVQLLQKQYAETCVENDEFKLLKSQICHLEAEVERHNVEKEEFRKSLAQSREREEATEQFYKSQLEETTSGFLSDLNSLKDTIDVSQEMIKTLESENMELRQDLVVAETDFGKAQKVYQNLVSQRESILSNVDPLKETVETSKEVILELEGENHTLKGKIEELEADLGTTKELLKKAQDAANDLLTQKRAVLDDIDELKEAIEMSQEVIESLEKDLQESQAEGEVLREHLGEARHKKVEITSELIRESTAKKLKGKAYATKLRILEQEKEELTKESSVYKLKWKAFEAKIRVSENEKCEVEQRVKELTLKNDELKDQLQEAKSDNDTTKMSNDHEIMELKSHIEHLSSEFKTMQRMNRTLTDEKLDIEEELNELWKNESTLKRHLAESESDCDRLRKQRMELFKQIEDYAQTETKLSCQITELEKSNQGLKHDFQRLLDRATVLESGATEETKSLAHELQKVKEHFEAMEESNTSLRQQVSHLALIKSDLSLDKQSLQKQLSELKQTQNLKDQQFMKTIAEKDKDTKSWKTACHDQEEAIIQMQEKVQSLQKMADKRMELFHSESEVKIQDLKLGTEKLTEELKESETFKHKCDDLQNNITIAESDNAELRMELSSISQDLVITKQSLIELSTENRRLKDEINSAKRTIESMIQDGIEERAVQDQILVESQSETLELEAQLKLLQESINAMKAQVISSVQGSANIAQQECNEYKVKMEQLITEATMFAGEISDLKNCIHEKHEQSINLEQLLQVQLQSTKDLELKLSAFSEQLVMKDRIIGDLTEKLKDKMNQLSVLKEEKESEKHSRSKIEGQLVSVSERLSICENQLIVSQKTLSEKTQEYEFILTQTQQTLDNLRSQNEELQSAIVLKNSKLTQMTIQITEQEHRIVQLQQVATMNRTEDENSQISDFQNPTNDVLIMEKLDTCEFEKQKLIDDRHNLCKEILELNSKLVDSQNKSEANAIVIDGLNQSINELINTNSLLEQKLKDESSATKEHPDFEELEDQWNTKVTSLEEENQLLRHCLNDAEKARQEDSDKIEELDILCTAQKGVVRKLREQIFQLENLIRTELSNIIKDNSAVSDDLELEHSKMGDTFCEINLIIKSVLNQVHQSKVDFMTHVTELKAEINNKDSELIEEKKLKVELQERFDQLSSYYVQIQSAYSILYEKYNEERIVKSGVAHKHTMTDETNGEQQQKDSLKMKARIKKLQNTLSDVKAETEEQKKSWRAKLLISSEQLMAMKGETANFHCFVRELHCSALKTISELTSSVQSLEQYLNKTESCLKKNIFDLELEKEQLSARIRTECETTAIKNDEIESLKKLCNQLEDEKMLIKESLCEQLESAINQFKQLQAERDDYVEQNLSLKNFESILKDQIQQSEEKENTLSNQIEHLYKETEILTQSKMSLQLALEDMTNKYNILESSSKKLIDENDNLLQGTELKMEENSQLKASIHELEKKIDELKDGALASNQQKLGLEEQIQGLASELNQKSKELTLLKQAADDVTEESLNLKAELKAVEDKFAQQVDEKRSQNMLEQNHAAEIETLKAKLAAAEEQSSMLSEEVTQMHQKCSSMAESQLVFKDAISPLEDRVLDLENNCEELSEKNENLKNKNEKLIHENKHLVDKNKIFALQLEPLQDILSVKNDLIEKVQSLETTCDHIHSERKHLISKVAEVEHKLAGSESEKQILQENVNDMLKKSDTSEAGLIERVEKLRCELDKAEQAVVHLKADKMQISSALEDVQNKFSLCVDERKSLESENKMLQSRLEDALQEDAQWHDKVHTLEATLESVEHNLEHSLIDNKTLQSELNQYKEMNGAAKKTKEMLENDIASLISCFQLITGINTQEMMPSDVLQQASMLQKHWVSSNEKIAELSEKLAATETVKTSLKQAVDNKEQAAKQFEDKVKSLGAELTTFKAKCSHIQLLTEELDLLKSNISELITSDVSHASSEELMQLLCSEFSKHQMSLKEKDQTITEMQNDISVFQAQWTNALQQRDEFIQQQVSELNSMKQELDEVKTALEETEAKRNKALDNAENMKNALNAAEVELDEIKKEWNTFKPELDSVQEIKSANDLLVNENKMLLEKLATFDHERENANSEMLSEYSKLQVQLSTQTQQLTQKRSVYLALLSALNISEEQLMENATQNTVDLCINEKLEELLCTERLEMKSQIANMENANMAANHKLDECTEKWDILAEQLLQAESVNCNHLQNVEHLTASNKKIGEELSVSYAKIESQGLTITQLNTEKLKSDDLIEKLTSSYSELKEASDELAAKNGSLYQKVTELSARLDQVNRQEQSSNEAKSASEQALLEQIKLAEARNTDLLQNLARISENAEVFKEESVGKIRNLNDQLENLKSEKFQLQQKSDSLIAEVEELMELKRANVCQQELDQTRIETAEERLKSFVDEVSKTQSLVEVSEQKQQQLLDEIEQLKKNESIYLKKLNDSSNEFQSLETKCHNLEGSIAHKASENAELAEVLVQEKELAKQLDISLKNKVLVLNEEKSIIQETLNKTRQELETLQTQKEDQESRLINCEKALHDRENMLFAAETQINTLKDELCAVENAKEKFLEQEQCLSDGKERMLKLECLNESQNETVRLLQKDIEAYKVELEEKTVKLENAVEHEAELKADLRSVNQALEEQDEIQQSLQNCLLEEKQSKQCLEVDVMQLKNIFQTAQEEAEELLSKIQLLENQLDQSQLTMKKQEELCVVLEEQCGHAKNIQSSLQHDLEKVQALLDSRISAYDELHDKNIHSENTVNRLQVELNEKQSKEEQLLVQSSEKDSLKAQLTDMEAKHQVHGAELTTCKKRFGALKLKFKQSENEKLVLQESVNKLSSEKTLVEQQLSETQGAVADLQHKVKHLEEELQNHLNEDSRNQLDQSLHYKALNDQTMQYKEELIKVMAARDDGLRQLGQMREQISQSSRRLETLELKAAENQVLKEQIREMEKNLDNVVKEKNELSAGCEDLQEALTEARASAESSEYEITELKEKLMAANDQLTMVTSRESLRTAELQSRLKELENQLKQFQLESKRSTVDGAGGKLIDEEIGSVSGSTEVNEDQILREDTVPLLQSVAADDDPSSIVVTCQEMCQERLLNTEASQRLRSRCAGLIQRLRYGGRFGGFGSRHAVFVARWLALLYFLALHVLVLYCWGWS